MESDKFNFTDEEFISVLNLVCEMDMGPGEEYSYGIEFDSLGMELFS